MKRILVLNVALAALMVSLSATAADLVFPNADGLGDLASDDSWSPYGWDDIAGNRILFADGTATYTMATNCTFDSFCLSNDYNTTVTFDLSNGVTNTLTGTGGLRLDPASYLSGKTRNNKTVFKGGVWDFSNRGSFTFDSGRLYGYATSMVLDGASFTNLTAFNGFNYIINGDNSIVLTNGAHITAATGYLAHESTEGGRKCFEVVGGSTFAMTNAESGKAIMGPKMNGQAVVEHLLRVAGKGSSFYWKSAGANSYAAALCITGSGKGLLRVEDEAKLEIDCTLKALGVNKATHNRLEVLSGAAMTVGKTLYFPSSRTSGAFDNTILVSNATLTCAVVDFAALTNEVLVLDGGRLETTGNFTVNGTGHRIVVDNSTCPLNAVDSSGEATWIFRGSRPRLSGNGFHAKGKTTFVFEFPEDGTGDFTNPIFSYYTCVKLDYVDTHVLSFPNLEAFRKTLTKDVEIPLFKSGLKQTDEQKGVRIPEAVLASANLPEWASFKQTEQSLSLCVKKPPRGLMLIFR